MYAYDADSAAMMQGVACSFSAASGDPYKFTGRVPLDKSEGSVKGKVILGGA